MNFIIGFLILTNWESHCYKSILIIIDWQVNIVYHKSVKNKIDITDLAKVILNIIVKYCSILNSIISNKSSAFT